MRAYTNSPPPLLILVGLAFIAGACALAWFSSLDVMTVTRTSATSAEVAFDDKLTKKVVVPGTALKPGANTLTFKTGMTGVLYRAVFRYWKAGRDIDPMDRGIKVERNFYLLDGKGSTVRQLKSGDAVPRGSYVLSEVAATHALPANMRYLTRFLLVPILLVPILWVWPQRGITAKFYPNTKWVRPALVRVERQISLDFMTADLASLPPRSRRWPTRPMRQRVRSTKSFPESALARPKPTG